MAALEKGGRATLMRALRDKYRTPREALKALGLDESLLDVNRLAYDGERSMTKPTRLEYLAVTRAARALNPTLAADAQIDYAPIFKGLTSKNFKSRKPTIVSDVKKALTGKIRKTLTMDAPMEHLAHLLNEMEHVKEPESLDESVSNEQHKAMEAAAHGHSNLGIPKEVGEEFERADTGKGFDAEKFGKWFKGKGGSEDALRKVHDMIRDELPENALDEEMEEIEGGEDEELDEEERRKKEAKDRKAKDKKAKDARDRAARDERRARGEEPEEPEEPEVEDGGESGEDRHGGRDGRRGGRDRRPGGMDSKYITVDSAEKIAKAAVAAERKRNADVSEARNFCRPFVGELPLALDSAEKIYRAAAKARGIEQADEISEPVALRLLIQQTGPAGARPPLQLVSDSAISSTADTLGRFPGMSRIGNA